MGVLGDIGELMDDRGDGDLTMEACSVSLSSERGNDSLNGDLGGLEKLLDVGEDGVVRGIFLFDIAFSS